MSSPTESLSANRLAIVVADRGWVFVGEVADVESNVVITHAKCIRRWGTTAGLGQLRSGRTKQTILDDAGTVVIPKRAEILRILCEPTAQF